MIDDLIESDLLINKDSLEVKKILGTPEYRDKENDFWQYYAGMSNGFGVVDHNLIVNFKHGKVSKLEYKNLKIN